ncbi:MAG: TonB-dependent receptor [Aeromicrobium sp.]|nr:TonB-dependent receptor [Burkholderiales bacterium]
MASIHQRNAPTSLTSLVIVTFFAAPLYSAEPKDAEKPKPPAAKVEQIEVRGSADQDRLSSTDSRLVVSRQDLLKFGDTTLSGALSRVLGVSVVTTPGQSAEVRIRGLGSGYTQITINGDPAPLGFELDSLSPAQVERIEVIRSPRADTTSQAIGGVINIILRKLPATNKATGEFRVNARTAGGNTSGGASAQHSQRQDQLAYAITASTDFVQATNQWIDVTEERQNQTPIFARRGQVNDKNKTQSVALAPKASLELSAQTKLQFDALAQHQRRDYAAFERRLTVFGLPPLYPQTNLHLDAVTNDLRGTLGVNHTTASGAQWEAKLVANRLDVQSNGRVDGFADNQRRLLARTIDARLRDDSVAATGRFSTQLADKHAFASGWNLQLTSRDETRMQREAVFITPIADNLDEGYDAKITRLSFYAQDEWNVGQRVSGYLGLRWEQLKTEVLSTADAVRVSQRTAHVSPTVQFLWKIPGSDNQVAKLSLGRAYKAPTTRELIPRRWVVNDNTATSPNFQGNPNLRPELSWNVDASYESKLANQQSHSVTIYHRRIHDIILPLVSQEPTGAWIQQPTNLGDAIMFGIEAQGRYRLPALDKNLPNIEWRPSITLARSRLTAIPGPDSRINQQPKLVFSMAADYRLKDRPLAMGANFRVEQIGLTRSSPNQTYQLNTRRFLDTYLAYGPVKGVTVRLSGQNLLIPNHDLIRIHEANNFTQSKTQSLLTQRTVRIELSMPL